MPLSSNLTEKFEEERLRTQEQSQIVYLQGQIDELRRLIKEQTNKYQWAVEQVRKTDAAVLQVQNSFERHAEEVAQVVERSRRDVIDVRKEISGAMVKIQESVEPIRQMQAQIRELAESRKQDRDQSFGWVSRVEDLEQRISSVHSVIHESEERHRQLASQISNLRDADGETLQEVRRLSEDVQIEKQSLRRQAIEAQQLVSDVHIILEEHDARITRVDEIRQNIELFAESVPSQIQEINKRFPDIEAAIKHIERVSTERFLMNQERLEELRHQADNQIVELQEAEEQHTHQHTTWLERIDGWLHELDQRMIRSFSRLDESIRSQMVLINAIEERELRSIASISSVVRDQVEYLREAQEEARKASEAVLGHDPNETKKLNGGQTPDNGGQQSGQ